MAKGLSLGKPKVSAVVYDTFPNLDHEVPMYKMRGSFSKFRLRTFKLDG